jgi:hypothetical protein
MDQIIRIWIRQYILAIDQAIRIWIRQYGARSANKDMDHAVGYGSGNKDMDHAVQYGDRSSNKDIKQAVWRWAIGV